MFAVIGLSAHKFLRTVIDTHEITQATTSLISNTSRAFTLMQRDFTHLADRQIRDEYGEQLPPLILGNGEFRIEFSRSGWNNPAKLPRSNLQRVAYQITDDGELQRFFWLVMDRAEDSEPIIQTLMTEVEDFRINVMDKEGNFSDEWPDFDNPDRLPRAIEILVTHKKLGELRKIYTVVQSADTNALQANPNAVNNPGSGDQNGINDRANDESGDSGDDPNAVR